MEPIRIGTYVKPSGLWLRSLAAIVDLAIVFCVWFLIIFRWGADSENGKLLNGWPAAALMLATPWYWIVPEWLTGATFGKWACDLRVVTLKGKKISFFQSVKRNLLRAIDFMPWYLTGFVAAKLTPAHQRLGDLWAKTIVVSCSELERSAPAFVSDTPSTSTN